MVHNDCIVRGIFKLGLVERIKSCKRSDRIGTNGKTMGTMEFT